METSDPVFHSIDLDNTKGLEIGPLYRPRVSQAYDVRYVDHYSTEELRAGYAVNSVAGPFIDEIVEVDYVLRDGETIASVTKEDAPFDYVVASHVIEHVVDPISWLRDVHEVLAPEGVISLVIPDKRFCSVDSSLNSVDKVLAASRRAHGPPAPPCGAPSVGADTSMPVASDGSEVTILSRKEQRLIVLKRTILARLRNQRTTDDITQMSGKATKS